MIIYASRIKLCGGRQRVQMLEQIVVVNWDQKNIMDVAKTVSFWSVSSWQHVVKNLLYSHMQIHAEYILMQ